MDRFRALSVFVAVADSSGFAPAAAKLHMSPTAVTRMIAALEAQVGVRLFARNTRRVRLTEAGALFATDARRILADLTEAEAAVSGAAQALRGRIRITAPVLFGRSHVAPIVLAFMHRYPDISVDLLLVDRQVDLLEEDIDVAVRIADLVDSAHVALRVGSVGRVLCASPDYLGRRGEPVSLSDLEALEGIDLASASPRQWTFRQGGADRTMRPRIVLSANAPDVVIAACVQGLGIARFMTYQVKAQLTSGALRALLPAHELPPLPVHLVYPTHRQVPRRVGALLDFMTQALRDDRTLSPSG